MSNSASPSTPEDSVPADFVALAKRWYPKVYLILLTFIWQGYDLLLKELPAGINEEDLERSITQSLELRIRRRMSGDEPFDIQHGPYERETRKSLLGQPPEYDLAFVLRADERIMWPIEGKVLETDRSIAEYKKGVEKFLTCYYAPFSSEGAMLGYLLSGTSVNAFRNLEVRIPCTLVAHPDFPGRPSKMSDHSRRVESGKSYPIAFRCHHLILGFFGFSRSKKPQSRQP